MHLLVRQRHVSFGVLASVLSRSAPARELFTPAPPTPPQRRETHLGAKEREHLVARVVLGQRALRARARLSRDVCGARHRRASAPHPSRCVGRRRGTAPRPRESPRDRTPSCRARRLRAGKRACGRETASVCETRTRSPARALCSHLEKNVFLRAAAERLIATSCVQPGLDVGAVQGCAPREGARAITHPDIKAPPLSSSSARNLGAARERAPRRNGADTRG